MAGRIGSTAVVITSLLLSTLLPTTFAADNTTIASSSYSNDDVQLAINVPEGSSLTDLYFKFEAPADHQWAAFGIGMVMDNSLMFVVYRSADNQGEPTVSTRVGHDHVMPEYYNETIVNVLEGSEVNGDNFVVNLHCKNCRSWGEGNLDTSSTNARFFYALGPDGTDLMSDDVSERISQHPSHPKQFTLNVQAATGQNGVPSFGSDDTEDSDDNDGGPFAGDGPDRGVAFHAFVMSFAFTIIFPLGYLFLRLFERVWLHWGLQAFGTVLVFLGVGSGIAVSKRGDISPNLTHPHQIIGLLVFIIVLGAVVLGAVGHAAFKKRGVPSPLMKGHKIVGPTAIMLGFINACIGLAWAGRPTAVRIGYAVFDLLVWVVILALVFFKMRRNRTKKAMNTPAAQNFRDTTTPAYSHVRGGSTSGQQVNFSAPPPAYGHDAEARIPLQSMNRQEHGPVEYFNVQPTK